MARRKLSHRPATPPEALRELLARQGVYALGRPSAVYLRWQHDADYVQRLTPEDRAWLSRFQDEFYRSATFRPELAIHDEDQQRENQRVYKANQRDALSRATEHNHQAEGRDPDASSQWWSSVEDELIEQLDLKRAVESE